VLKKKKQVVLAKARASEGQWQDTLTHLLALLLFFDASDDAWLLGFPLDSISLLRSSSYLCMKP
jgi:hypothetical protein